MIKNSTETKSHGLNTVTISGYEAFFFFFSVCLVGGEKRRKEQK